MKAKEKSRKSKRRRFSGLFFTIVLILSLASSAGIAAFAAQAGNPYDEHKLETVSPVGTKINLFDYWLQEQNSVDSADALRKQGLLGGNAGLELITNSQTGVTLNNEGINKGHEFKFNMGQSNVSANKWAGSGALSQGLFNPTLANGYPMLKRGNGIRKDTSLAYLFDTSKSAGKVRYSNVKGLLRVDREGYYYYNSGETFASYNKAANSFDIYDTPAIANGRNNGQFFPFNKASDVFDVQNGSLHPKGLGPMDDRLNHWFGVSMTTRFVQPEDGMVGNRHMTYHFSGDDDVLVYIDDVLVGDVGGIHDKASLDIDFNTGSVVVQCGNTKNTTNLKSCYRKVKSQADIDRLFVPGKNTFKKDTYHTLRFFYLERGHNESNMSLKFNLKAAPESSMHKIDENGNPVKGAKFDLWAIDKAGNKLKKISSGVTGEDGTITFIDADGLLVDFNMLHDKFGYDRYMLDEISIPDGYRSSGDVVTFSYKQLTKPSTGRQYGYLESDNIYGTGAFAAPVEMVQSPSEVKAANSNKVYNLNEGGLCFAVVLGRSNDPSKPDLWHPVTGDHITGWTFGDPLTSNGRVNNALIAAAKENGWILRPSASGSFDTFVNKLPGKVEDYYFASGDSVKSKYTVAFYYTSSNTLDGANIFNTKLLNTTQFQRSFGTELFIPNVKNTFTVQKVDSSGNPITDTPAVFELYDEKSVSGGQVIPGAKPIDTLATSTDPSEQATVKFGVNVPLNIGKYYVREKSAPTGYVKNDNLVEVYISKKDVYANAGVENDGIYVQRGVGRLLTSVGQFAKKGHVNNTLTNLVTSLRVTETLDPNISNWPHKKQDPLHLKYSEDPNSKLEYVSDQPGGAAFIGTDVGWSDLDTNQCKDPNHTDIPRDELDPKMDLSECFTGRTHIRISNSPQIELSKIVEGSKTWNGDTFEFAVEPKDAATKAAMEATPAKIEIPAQWSNIKLSEASPNVLLSLGDIKFTTEGKYSFSIVEKLPEIKGNYLYSDEVYVLNVEVNQSTDPNRKGLLEVKYTLTDKTGKEIKQDATKKTYPVKFTNIYNPPISADGVAEVPLVGTKHITGRNFKFGDRFTFVIEADATNPGPLPQDSTGAEIDRVTIAPEIGTKAEIDFGSITFGAADMQGATLNPATGKYEKTFVYKIKELEGSSATLNTENMIYDSTVVTATIKVTDNGHGIYKASAPEFSSGKEMSWTNVYTGGKKKTVRDEKDNGIDGDAVSVGSVLTYKVKWVNAAKDASGNFAPSKVTITDTVPVGTKLIEASLGNGKYDSATNTITWNIDAKPASSGIVSFKVKVLESAAGTDVDNQATIQIGSNNPAVTNTVTNFVPGKTAFAEGGKEARVQVGRTLTYTITYKNTEKTTADISISDIIPQGTEYVHGSATEGGVYSNSTTGRPSIKWTIPNVPAGTIGTVSFSVKITKDALTVNSITNEAFVKVGNREPAVKTNVQSTQMDKNGTLTIAKHVTEASGFVAPVDALFGFKVDFVKTGLDPAKTYHAHKFDAAGNMTLGFDIKSGDVVKLKADEMVKVYDIEPETKYTVTEVNIPTGFNAVKPAEGIEVGNITGGMNSATEFTNQYKPKPIVVPSGQAAKLGGTKMLDGRTFKEGDNFKFVVTMGAGSDEPAPLPGNNGIVEFSIPKGSALIGKNVANFKFGQIELTKPGTFIYRIKEYDPNLNGEKGLPSMSYDKLEYRMTLVASDDKGQLKVTEIKIECCDHQAQNHSWKSIYHDTTGAFPTENPFVFTNKYSIDSIKLAPHGEKRLEGKDISDYPADQMFGFIVEAGGIQPIGSKDKFVVDAKHPQPMPAPRPSGKYQGKHVYFHTSTGTLTVPDITYTQEDAGKEYKYIIRELQPTKSGLYSKNKADWLPGVTMQPDGKLVLSGVVFDDSEKVVIVRVTKTLNAQLNQHELNVEAIYPNIIAKDNIVFINKYIANKELALSGNKHITGRDFKKGDKFTFNIEAIDGAPLPKDAQNVDLKTVTVTPESGNKAAIDFGTLKFNQDTVKDAPLQSDGSRTKTFQYKITEQKGNSLDMTYDTAPRIVSVKVTDDGKGNLTAELAGDALKWTNVYTGGKLKDAKNDKNQGIEGSDIQVGDIITYSVKWVNNAKDTSGKLCDADIQIKDIIPAGTKYVDGSASSNGIYDSANQSLTWNIKAQAAQSGHVSFKVQVTEDALEYGSIENTADISIGSNKPVSTNTVITPLAANEMMTIRKVIKLSDPLSTQIDTGKEFTFTVNLKDKTGNPLVGAYSYHTPEHAGQIKDGQTLTLKHDQEAVIDGLPAGGTYTATEKAEAGYVSVMTKDADGTLVFTNTYKFDKPVVLDVSEVPELTKVLKGRDWTESDTFKFTIKGLNNAKLPTDENGKAVSEVTVSKPAGNSAKFGFGKFTFTKAGTYEYQIAEVKGNIPGITYDQTVVTLKIKVTDDRNGKLTIAKSDITVSNNGTFTNEYSSSNSVALSGTKTITGRDFAPKDKFTFNIEAETGAPLPKDAEGKELKSVTIEPASGNSKAIDFGKLSFTAADLKGVSADDNGVRTKEFKYTITEAKGPNANMMYDDTPKSVTIKLTDDGKGKLTAVLGGDELKWTNVYTGGKSKDVTNEAKECIDGEGVNIGDVLTYTINWVNTAKDSNGKFVDSKITITDIIPEGTEFVKGSAGAGVYDAKAKTLSWNIDAKAASSGTVSFRAKVTEAAAGFDIENQATIKIGSNKPVQTNTVTSFVPGKSVSVEDISGAKAQVGKEMTYKIRYKNTEKALADIIIEDTIPEGTVYVEGSANNDGVYTSGQTPSIKWVIKNVPAGAKGTVSFKVKVTEDALKLDSINNTATVKVGNNNPIQTNNTTKTLDENVNLAIKKTVEVTPGQGTVIDKNKEFTFTVNLKDVKGNSLEDSYSYTCGNTTGKITDGSVITLKHNEIAEIKNLPAGTQYKITETQLPGYTANHTMQEGTAKGNTVEFINTYSVKPNEFIPSVSTGGMFTKALIGREWNAGETFEFEITKASFNGDKSPQALENIPMPAETKIKISKPENGNETKFRFGNITFDKTGTYVYEIREVKGEDPAITYSDNVAVFEVVVSDNGEGNLASVATVKEERFNNYYNSEIDLSGKLGIYKVLHARAMTEGQFSFKLVPDKNSSEKLNIPKDGLVMKSPAAEMDTEAPLKIFDNLIFTEDDAGKTFGFTVTETGSAPSGYTFNTPEYSVNIKVSDLGNGKMKADVTVDDGKKPAKYTWTTGDSIDPVKIVFDNSYSASTSANSEISIEANKTMLGKPLGSEVFIFNIKDLAGNVVSSGTNVADGKIVFDKKLTYTIDELNTMVKSKLATKAGNVFRVDYVAEEDVSKLGAEFVATKSSFKFYVEITDNGDGTLTPKVVYPEGGLNFINTYIVENDNIPLVISGSKELVAEEGLTPPSIEGKFTFTLEAMDDVAGPLPEKVTVTNDAAGNINFGQMSFGLGLLQDVAPEADGSRTKVFSYKVTESGTVSGITNDPLPKTFTVTLMDDGKGNLSVATDANANIKFVNRYDITDGSSSSITDTVKISKKLAGRDITAGEFKFEMVDSNNKVVATGTNDEKGEVLFTPITYTKPGSFIYTVHEVNEGKTGVTYDATEHIITTTVTDNSDGTLSVKHESKDGDIVFENKYKPENTSVNIIAAKQLIGKELKAGQFDFEMNDEKGKVISKATNDANGQIIFDTITFDKEGTFKYTVSEVKGKDKDIQYDKSVFNVTVNVEDDKNGYLNATVVFDNPEGIIFVNKYENPGEPGGPDEPGNPGNPGGPEDPNNPGNPGGPEDPNNPNNPGNPDGPETPTNPANPPDSSGTNTSGGSGVQTGDNANTGALLTILISAFGLAALIRKRKHM